MFVNFLQPDIIWLHWFTIGAVGGWHIAVLYFSVIRIRKSK